MVIGAWARRRSLDFGPFFAVRRAALRLLDARLGRARPGRHVHPLRGRPRAPRLHPRARGDRGGGRPGSPRVGARGIAEAATTVFTGATLAFAAVAALFGSLFVHAGLGRQPGQVHRRRRRPRRAGAPMTDRVMSIDASGTKYWTGRGGVVLVNDPIETVEQRRARLRHPLARPRPRGQRRRRPRRSSTTWRRPAWLGRADRRRAANRCRSWSVYPVEPALMTRRETVRHRAR